MRLPLDLDIVKSLSDEFKKISSDAGTRATLAGKLGKGQTYLPGGELPSTSPTQTNFVPKIASQEARDTIKKYYEKARGPAISALGGAGLGVVMGNVITGGRLGNFNNLSRLGLRASAAIGAGVGLADHYGRSHLKKALMPKEKQANFISSTFTPARQLTEGVRTGGFEKLIHQGGRLRPPKYGKKFPLVSEMP